MKIGVITFWKSKDNYGEVLQCYALQKYLKSLGHDVFLIRYDPAKDFKKTFILIRCLKVLNINKLSKYIKKKKQQK